MTEFPQSWANTPLATVLLSLRDGTHTPPKRSSEGVPLLSARNIQNGRIDWTEIYSYIAPEDYFQIQRTNPIIKGDVLLTIVGSIGRSCVVRTSDRFTLQRSVAIAKPNPHAVDADYLSLFFRSPQFQAALEELASGTAQRGVYLGTLKTIPIALAPLNEQRRIVAKLEQLLSRVNAAQERLATIPRILKRFRQSVLAAACSGRLTIDWREEEQIEFWADVTLSDVISERPKNGYSAKPVKYETPWRVLTLTATTSGRFDGRQFKYFDEPVPADSELWLKPGDILIQRGNTIEYVGVPALYDGQPNEFVYPDLMIRVRASPRIKSEFLYFVLTSERTRAFLRGRAIGTAGNMPKINQSVLLSVPILLPPITEQQEIIRRVEALFKAADALEGRYRKAKAHVDKLTQSILAKAFRGGLVPQDPTDEPASVMLERIRQSRDVAAVKKRSARR